MAENVKNGTNHLGDRGKQFMISYVSIQRRLFGFVLSMIPNITDADDIVQDTVSIMWSKYDEFEQGTDFAAWAFQIARFQIFNYRRRMKAISGRFSDESMDAILEIAESREKQYDTRHDTLRDCVNKLKNNDKEVLHLRYEIGSTLQNVAERLGQNINTLYSSLNRIHIILLHCIRKNTAHDEVEK